MMLEEKVHFVFSPEIEEALSNSKISIEDILRQESIDAEIVHEASSYELETGVRTKKLTPVLILSGGIAISSVIFAISHTLDTVYHRPHFVEYYEYVEVKNEDGSIFLDEKGDPIFKAVRIQKIVEPRAQENKDIFEAGYDPDKGIMIKFSSEDSEEHKQLNPENNELIETTDNEETN